MIAWSHVFSVTVRICDRENNMKTSATPAKISRPSSSGVFPRDRLFRLLDHSRDQSILWITGPPGSGKTTLMTSWLEARQMHSLWYQVDEGDSDPASFFYYLRLAAKRANPRKRKPLPLLHCGVSARSPHIFAAVL